MASRVNNAHECHDIQLVDVWDYSVLLAKHNLLSLLNEETLNQKSGLRIFVFECFYLIIPQQFKSHPYITKHQCLPLFSGSALPMKASLILHWHYTLHDIVTR